MRSGRQALERDAVRSHGAKAALSRRHSNVQASFDVNLNVSLLTA